MTTQERAENGNGKYGFWFKVLREFGALALLGGAVYYILVNHSTDTKEVAEAVKLMTMEITKSNQKLDTLISIWSVQKNQSVIPQNVPTN